jgi:hypothetical protein
LRRLSLFFLFLAASAGAGAQEFICKVIVNADQVQTTDRAIFREMERVFAQFLMSRKWSSDSYRPHERIACSFLININKMPSIGSYVATVQVQSARPVYNTNYQSPLFNFADREWEFEYVESLPLEYNDNAFTTNLTSMLAFYAYVILGMDYDSFSEMGGTPYFQKALNIVNVAQQSNRSGWQPLDGNRTRYALIENLTNSQMSDLRKGAYAYHRLALDTYDKNPDESRNIILGALRNIRKIWGVYPNSIGVIAFMDAKRTELANLFSEGSMQVRREAYDLLVSIDPAKRDFFNKIVQN